jgi:hypothetical protein
MYKRHEIKSINPYFTDVWLARKNFEVRENDRNYKAGDFVLLRELLVDSECYSGRSILVIITYILKNFPQGLNDNYIVFSFHSLKYNTK